MPTTIPSIWSTLGREKGPVPSLSADHREAPSSPTNTSASSPEKPVTGGPKAAKLATRSPELLTRKATF